MMRFAFGGRSRPGLWAPGLAVVLAGLAVQACGPSFQALYEGEVHFEHCYAMDQKAGPVDEKKECWRDWLRGYTYGQSNDRVEYAATRFSLLSLDPTLPTEEDHGARPRKDRSLAAAPLPTSAFAPPPNINAVEKKDVPDASPPAPEAHPMKGPEPGTDCVRSCDEHWESCHAGCKDKACEACDKAYRTCMPACFREAPAGHGK
jgi:hypothetical protein